MCVELNDSQLQITLPDFAAFYWIINCDLLEQISSPDISLCDGLSEVETVAVQSSAEPMLIGYVVDDELHQTSGQIFHRYLFNSSKAILTENQPIEGPSGFECSSRPWFVQNWMCTNPTAASCPEYLIGSTGIGAFQTYGSTDTAVVAQDIRNYQLCVCLEDMPCNAEEQDEDPSSMTPLTIGIIVGSVCFFAIAIICICRGRIKRAKLFNI